jgi:hypothetical protein
LADEGVEVSLIERLLSARVAGVLLAAAAVMVAGSPSASDRSGVSGAVTAESTTRVPDMATILDFAHGQGISVEDAVLAFRDTKAILDFKGASSNDGAFGDVWVDYEGGYRVHVRSLNPSFAGAIDRFEKKLGRPVVRHLGGASATEMSLLMAQLRQQASTVGWRTNVREGLVEVYASGVSLLPPDLRDSSFVRVIPGSPPVVQPQAK